MLDYCDWRESGDLRRIAESSRRVIGVDIDVREHNRALIDKHPMSSKVTLIEVTALTRSLPKLEA